MKAVALGLIEDLRAKRLWPVAILMLAALIAVPVVLLKPTEESPSPAAAPAASGAPAPGGLPSPEEALAEGNGRSLVTLAVLGRPSTLGSFDSKNPFRPLRQLDGSPETEFALAQAADGSGASSIASGGDTGEGSPAGGVSPGPGAPTGDSPTGDSPTGDLPILPDLPDATPLPDPTPTPDPGPAPLPEQRLSYAVDLTFDGPDSAPRSYRNLPRLSMLPSADAPLLVFLGVGAEANGAVFLVDSTVQAVGGDAKCTPSPTECATLTIEPGEQQTFVDAQENKYFLQIDQIREVPVERAERATRARKARTARTAVGRDEPVRRFVLPELIDLIVIGGQS